MNEYLKLYRITMKHRGGAAKYLVEIGVSGNPAVVTSHYFTFANPSMESERILLNYRELSTVLDVVDAYKRSRVWA